MIREA